MRKTVKVRALSNARSGTHYNKIIVEIEGGIWAHSLVLL